jgi:hypothetical protein
MSPFKNGLKKQEIYKIKEGKGSGEVNKDMQER